MESLPIIIVRVLVTASVAFLFFSIGYVMARRRAYQQGYEAGYKAAVDMAKTWPRVTGDYPHYTAEVGVRGRFDPQFRDPDVRTDDPYEPYPASEAYKADKCPKTVTGHHEWLDKRQIDDPPDVNRQVCVLCGKERV